MHDPLNVPFRHRPQFAVEILRDRLGLGLPDGLPVQLVGNELNDRPSIDLYPDTVITVGPQHAPLHAIIVEIQQREESSKQQALPRYAAALWLQLACPVTVLVICPTARTAIWAAKPIDTSLSGYTLTCQVIGPDHIPIVTDPAEAAACPELAAMSVMAHGEHAPVLEAFVAALGRLPGEHAPQYYEYAYRLASQASDTFWRRSWSPPPGRYTAPSLGSTTARASKPVARQVAKRGARKVVERAVRRVRHGRC
uniref:hypothetical protein n=1 Tax=Microbispora cellulosiformans TaxID=2614688 RepID=UPI001CD9D917|nr:hypothetical protein [Microbispora cellulosiformans]